MEERLLALLQEEAYKPLTVQELEEALQLTDSEQFRELVKTLNQLEEKGEVVRTRANRYAIPQRVNLFRGHLQKHPKGFGFILLEESQLPDVYVHASDMMGAMHGDLVLVRIEKGSREGKQWEGEVVRILQRANQVIVGTYMDEESFGFVRPDDNRVDRDIFIPKGKHGGAVDGHKVVVRIVKFPEGRMSAEGEVIEILGHKNDPGIDILSIVRKYGIPEKFSDETIAEADKVPEAISPEDLISRRDLRGQAIITIDGADAKDLDDAVAVEKLANGHYRLGVHIADVSHYVREGSELDKEALARGCSVYLVDRVIPMLPHRLSNGICSLNPRQDRLTLSCEMEIDAQGKVVHYEIFPSVIRTVERMTYEDMNQILKREDETLLQRYETLLEMFFAMNELSHILRKKRMARGAIDFDLKEAKVLVNEKGEPLDVVVRERGEAERLIEEFMLAANETVAEHYHWMQVPFMYRIHEDPNEEKMLSFLAFIANLGYVIHGTANQVHPLALQSLLSEIEGQPEEAVINSLLLRSMKQARYANENLGHYGLATSFYTHFTSPIRRYPDLIVHRLIHRYVNGPLSEGKMKKLQGRLAEIADQASIRERVAVDAERETDDLKKAEFMMDKIGEEFEGVISGVTSFGLFVELPNTIEGMVHVSYMTDDFYSFHEKAYALVGERTGKIFRIGDQVRVRVIGVNKDERKIDMEIVGTQSQKREKKRQPTVITAGKVRADRSRSRQPKKVEEKAGEERSSSQGDEWYSVPSRKRKHRQKKTGTGKGKSSHRTPRKRK